MKRSYNNSNHHNILTSLMALVAFALYTNIINNLDMYKYLGVLLANESGRLAVFLFKCSIAAAHFDNRIIK